MAACNGQCQSIMGSFNCILIEGHIGEHQNLDGSRKWSSSYTADQPWSIPQHNMNYDQPASPEVDMVNHPPHYTSHPSGVECIDVTEHYNFNIGNAIKYLWRTDLKDDPIENLEKAVFYVNREIVRRSKVTAPR